MTSYLDSGVNLSAAEAFVKGVSKIAAKTFNQNVIGSIGGFAGLYRLPTGYKNPILVSCTDGVGSKLKLAYENKRLENIGQDLVAMCVNDLLCTGAKPLFFLDYLATERLNPEEALIIANSIGQACEGCGAVLIGGETAELPSMLPTNGYELAGFSVGIVEEDLLLNPINTQAGDVLIGLPSSGLHSNGYSLVRSIVQDLDLNEKYKGLNRPLIEELLAPTLIYVKQIQPLMSKIKAIAHITGGGLPENLPRSFNKSLKAIINRDSWTIPSIFRLLQEKGQVEEQEMFRVFNMGIGLVLIVSAAEKDDVCSSLQGLGQAYYELGQLEKLDCETEPRVKLI